MHLLPISKLSVEQFGNSSEFFDTEHKHHIVCDGMDIGRYFTKEKALEVLDMIAKAYNEVVEDMKGDKFYDHKCNKAFEMPIDDSI